MADFYKLSEYSYTVIIFFGARIAEADRKRNVLDLRESGNFEIIFSQNVLSLYLYFFIFLGSHHF